MLKLSSGHKFEFSFSQTIIMSVKRGIINSDVNVTVGTDDDTLRGTDLIIDDIRVDFTSNFSNKDHLTFTHESAIKTKLGKVLFGIRTGNSRVDFEEPVVVVGVDCFGNVLNKELDGFFDDVQNHIKEIVDEIVNTFFDFEDAREGGVI